MQIKMLINGELVAARSGQVMSTINPANGQVLGHSPLARAEDVDLAVHSSLQAFESWSDLHVKERKKYLQRLAIAIGERKEEIAEIEAVDSGNTIHCVRQDVDKSIAALEYYAGLGYEASGKTVPATPENLHLTVREPYGVCARIVPFNHPFLFAAARIAAPLMAGNTVVVKPADQSPLSAGILAEIIQEVLPPGVVNIVTGDGLTGEALVRHPHILRIAFTGSTETGLKVQKSAADSGIVKNVTLELGGKNPFILYPDAQWEKAVEAAILGMNFNWQGQSCGSTSRLLVHESIYDQTVEAIVKQVSRLKVGDPTSESIDMGPINSKVQYEKVLDYIQIGKEEGATLIYGGTKPEGLTQGYWILPTVFSDVTKNMRLAQEEIFGPVLSIMKWSNEDELIGIVNSTDFGLAAAIWSQNVNTCVRLSKKIKSGYIWINGVGTHFAQLPFGGYKQSGVGREEGVEELLSYTQSKTIHFIQ